MEGGIGWGGGVYRVGWRREQGGLEEGIGWGGGGNRVGWRRPIMVIEMNYHVSAADTCVSW